MDRIPQYIWARQLIATLATSVAWFFDKHTKKIVQRGWGAAAPTILEPLEIPGWQQECLKADRAISALSQIADEWGFDNTPLIRFGLNFNPLVSKRLDIPRDAEELLERLRYRAITLSRGKPKIRPPKKAKNRQLRENRPESVCPIDLRGDGAKPLIDGMEDEPIFGEDYRIITLLVGAWPLGRTKGQLENAGFDSPNKRLDKIRRRSRGWENHIHMPGKNGRGGYRIV